MIEKIGKKKRGRPCKTIDWKLVEKRAREGCSGITISRDLGIIKSTLYDACRREKKISFDDYVSQCRATGDCAIIGKIYTLALRGNTRLLEMLAKERLGWGKNEAVISIEIEEGFTAIMNYYKDLQNKRIA